jgi:hypothetical protein
MTADHGSDAGPIDVGFSVLPRQIPSFAAFVKIGDA